MRQGIHLDQEPQVDILALGFFPVHLTVLVVSDVNSLEAEQEESQLDRPPEKSPGLRLWL